MLSIYCCIEKRSPRFRACSCIYMRSMMELLPPPARTPDHPPTIRRLFTAPLPKTSRSIRDLAEEDAETLYAHNAGKIVSFSPPISGTRRHSSVEQGHVALQDEPVGTLPWASATERTIAAGHLSLTPNASATPLIHLQVPYVSTESSAPLLSSNPALP